MRIPVYIPGWQVEDGDVPPPVVGGDFSHVLLFSTHVPGAEDFYGQFGREVSLSGTAIPLHGHEGQYGRHPVRFDCAGFSLFWAAPSPVSGRMNVKGIIHADSYGEPPVEFPEVRGRVYSLVESSLPYLNSPPGSVTWIPKDATAPRYRPVGECPRWFPHQDLAQPTQDMVTGVVMELETVPAYCSAAPDPATTTPAATRIRLFPQRAGSVLWLLGPLDYGRTALSSGLVTAMQRWEAGYNTALAEEPGWRSPIVAADFSAMGNQLAALLARELGADFDVEFTSHEPGSRRRVFHSDAHAENRKAAKRLRKIVSARGARQPAKDGTSWFTYAPQSGTTYRPQ
jgi:hypothetical protein